MKTTTLASRRSIESAVPESAWSRERSPTRRNHSRSREMVGQPCWRAHCPSPIGQLSCLTPTERAHYPWHHHDQRHETRRSCETCSPGRRYGSAFGALGASPSALHKPFPIGPAYPEQPCSTAQRRDFRMFLGFGFGLRNSTWKSRSQYSISQCQCPSNLRTTKKGRRTPRTTVSTLNDDVLLNIFDWYRLYNTTDEDQGWNLERWWYKPIHVCRKWRHLILTSPTRLDLHLVCTYGIPVEAMLSHSPPLPLIIYYPEITGKISAADEESALFALQQRERVRRIHVTAPTAILCNLFKAMDCEFLMLQRLALHTFTQPFPSGESRAPHSRHRSLFPASKYLPSGVAAPIWRGSWLGSARRSSEIHFDNDFVSVIVDPHPEPTGTNPFLVQVKCRPLDYQAACAAQICHALAPLLAGVDSLTLGFHKDGSASWQDEIDHPLWHGLLRTFAGVKSLRLTGGLVGDLFRSLQLDEGELPLELLPGLRELVPSGWGHTDDAFASFISARQSAGRRIR